MSLDRASLVYLERVRRNYPGGVPHKLIRAKRGVALLFVLGASCVSRAGSELLSAAITKGLNLEAEEVERLAFEDPEALARRVTELRPRMIYLLGESVACAALGLSLPFEELRAGIYLIESVPTVVSYDPGEVALDPRLKRALWDDLRRARSVINRL